LDERLDQRHLDAIARYSLVGGLVTRNLDRGELSRVIEEIAQDEVHIGPDGRARRLSRTTLYRDLGKARLGVWELMRKPRSDKGTVRALRPEVLDALISLREQAPAAAVPILIRVLENKGVVEPGQLHASTLRRILRDRDLSSRKVRAATRAYRRFEVEGPMAMWFGDASPGVRIGHVHAQLYVWLDGFSRFALAARYYENQRLPAFDDCLMRAIIRFGVPDSIYVDRGSAYVSHHFKRVCGDLGIRLIHARPYQPTGRGRMERFFRTCQEQFEASARALVDDGTIKSLDDLNRYFMPYLDEYNARPNETTKEPPATRLGQTTPYPDMRALTEIFLWREDRLVSKRGEVAIAGNHYAAPDDLVGTSVTVAYRPFDLRQVYLQVDNKLIPALPSVPVRHLVHSRLETPVKAAKKPSGPADYVRHLPRRDVPEFALTDFGRKELCELLATALARALQVEEEDLLSAYLGRPGLPPRAVVEATLDAFVRRHGQGQHLSRYLDAIWGNR
jgi:putative transposase